MKPDRFGRVLVGGRCECAHCRLARRKAAEPVRQEVDARHADYLAARAWWREVTAPA
jgi:hypothetical protein